MSADLPHDALGQGFLGHLVERVQPKTTQMQIPTLERRRPGIFEPRAPVAATALDIAETRVAPSASSFSRATTPTLQAPSPVPRAAAAGPLVPTTQAATAITAASPMVSPPQIPTPSRAAQPAAPPPNLAIADKPRGAASVATRSLRRDAADTASAVPPTSRTRQQPGPVLSPTSPLPTIIPPQAITVRSARTVRVEHSRLESRTTVVERGSDKHRDPPAPATPTLRLNTPPRLASREASRTPVAHPVRSAAMLAAPAPVTPAPVQVSIGRVEIRGIAGTPPAASHSAVSKPQLGLDEYLQQRHGNGR